MIACFMLKTELILFSADYHLFWFDFSVDIAIEKVFNRKVADFTNISILTQHLFQY